MTNKVRRIVSVPPDYDLYRGGLTKAFRDTPQNYNFARQRIVRVNDGQNGIDWAGGDLSAGGQRIVDLGTATEPGDAVTKAQLDAFDDRITANEQAIVALDGRVTQNEADIALLQTIALDLVPAAHGSMAINAPPVSSPNVPTGTNNWLPITFYQTVDVENRGCTFNPVDGTVSIQTNVTGVWQFSFGFAFDHSSSNSDRQFNFRFFNVTDGVQAGSSVPIYIGRNRVGTNWAISFLSNIDSSAAGKLFRGEIGEADSTISGVNWRQLDFDAHFTDRLGNLIDPIQDP